MLLFEENVCAPGTEMLNQLKAVRKIQKNPIQFKLSVSYQT